jgi:transcriptional regulator with XRE-family HTH domain
MLRSIRASLGYTQARFAALVGVHPLTVSRWECGTLEPTPIDVRLLRVIEIAISRDGMDLQRRLRHVGSDPIRELTTILVVVHPDLATEAVVRMAEAARIGDLAQLARDARDTP